jgi:mevalonate kinase
MRRSRHTRIILSIASKRRALFEEDSDSYFEHRAYRRNQISVVEAKNAMKEIIDEIESLTSQMKECLKKIESAVEDEKLKEIDNFAKELTRLTNAITVAMSKFAEEVNN